MAEKEKQMPHCGSDAQSLREAGKLLLAGNKRDAEDAEEAARRKQGKDYILQAFKLGDPEATYITAALLLSKELRMTQGADREEYAMKYLYSAANAGYTPARVYIERYCRRRYDAFVAKRFSQQTEPAPLCDFDGKRIEIDRRGSRTPVDALLSFENGRNILTLSANLSFVYSDGVPDEKKFEDAVARGMKLWEGDYEVFGGQKLSVKVQLTKEVRLFDNVIIMPVTDTVYGYIGKAAELMPKKKKAIMNDTMVKKRSFATMGMKKWSVTSMKAIYIQSSDGKFDDYEEIKHVAKHEFGHSLGLGDLYSSNIDGLDGVRKGTYAETDSYHISDRTYALVMCDHHATVSNNDIEMVVLAFCTNRQQNYQPTKCKGEISAALGRGN